MLINVTIHTSVSTQTYHFTAKPIKRLYYAASLQVSFVTYLNKV